MARAAPAPRRVTGKRAAWVAIAVGFLTLWEGYAPVAKHERIDPPGVITVCFGMTNYDRDVRVGQQYSKAECQRFLAEDLPRYAADVEACVPSFPDMPPYRQAALVSFAYNLGKGTLCRSSVARYLNSGDIAAGCNAMLLYVKANGKYLRGLDNRRHAERDLCIRDD